MEEQLPQQPMPNANIAQKSNSGNSTIWLVVGAVTLVLIILGAAYWYMSQKSSKATQAQNAITTSSLDALDSDISSIDIGAVDSDLADIDKDLQSL